MQDALFTLFYSTKTQVEKGTKQNIFLISNRTITPVDIYSVVMAIFVTTARITALVYFYLDKERLYIQFLGDNW